MFTSDVEQRKQRSQNNRENKHNSDETKKNFTGSYTEVNPEKHLVERLKQMEIVVQDSSKSTGILGKMEGENSMEKCQRVFRAHSHIFLWRSEVIDLLKSLRHRCDIVRHRR